MYKYPGEHQITFFDFNQSCGMQLDPHNEWVILADKIDWKSMEKKYAAMFPSQTGRPAKPLRMALGSLIIQKRKNLSDRALMKEIAENPYLQYFIGLEKYEQKEPFRATSLVAFRKRFNSDFLMEANELYLSGAESTPEHKGETVVPEAPSSEENFGTMILDATCSPSNIRYPQDFVLLNESREKLEEMIDYFHKLYHPWKKPRTYREVAQKEYLTLAKTRRRTIKAIRKVIRKQLGYLNRDLRYLSEYMSEGYALPKKYINNYLTINLIYIQQKYMFDKHTHRVEDRIVSIDQPYLRPIVRGKANAPVEFGAKYDVSVDEKGHARLEKISFDPYNESTVFQDAVERYKDRTGRYPERVLVDQIYRNRSNREYCKENGIIMSGPKLGRPKKEKDPGESRQEYQDNADRIEVERFFSLAKRCSGAGLIMTRLPETTLHSIALSVFVTNLFAIPVGPVFLFYFWDYGESYGTQHYILFDEAADLYEEFTEIYS